jgi:hypothetical protein
LMEVVAADCNADERQPADTLANHRSTTSVERSA